MYGGSNKQLAALINTKKELEDILKIDVAHWDYRTRPAMEVRVNHARHELDALKQEYTKVVSGLVSKVWLEGTRQKEEYLKKFKSGWEAFIFDDSTLYKEVTDMALPLVRMGGSVGASAYLRMLEVTAAIARSCNVAPRPMKEPVGLSVNTRDELFNLVKSSINESYGDTLIVNFFTQSLLEQAWNSNFKGVTAILLLSNFNQNEKGLSDKVFPGQPSFVLNLDEGEESEPLKVIPNLLKAITKALKPN